VEPKDLDAEVPHVAAVCAATTDPYLLVRVLRPSNAVAC
jgi:hypothetical protein